MSMNDKAITFFRDGGTGPMNKAQMNWLASQGATGNTLPDRWLNYLTGQGYTTGTLQDRLRGYLRDEGYSGSLPDMLKAWFSGPVVAYEGFLSLEGDFSGSLSLEGDFSGSLSLEGSP